MENYITQCLARNIRFFRQQRQMSRKVLGTEAGISEEYVALIEKGKRYPSAGVLDNISKALKVPVSRLFRDDAEMFEQVSGEELTVFQGKLEEITVLVEEMHGMLETFQQHRKEAE